MTSPDVPKSAIVKSKSKPKRAFMRAMWGVHDDSHRITNRRFRVDRNMERLITNNYNEPFIVYTYGKETHETLSKIGFNSIMLSENPFEWDLIDFCYRHKLEALRYAFEEDGYDEIIHLDWDCYPTKKMPSDFWEVLGQKEAIQANLQKYKAGKCNWRDNRPDYRYIPNGGFLYIRDKEIPAKLIEIWDNQKKYKRSAEPALGRLTDDMMGGWKGIDTYWDLFEPEFCNLRKRSAYVPERRHAKNSCFIHHAGGK
jgi:hypothetical protein